MRREAGLFLLACAVDVVLEPVPAAPRTRHAPVTARAEPVSA
ncbi:hypothetical protein ACL07V_24385 [Streptomyces sp. MB22_4]